ncbi:MAG: PilW family protein [Candidatus Berkiella sp.]
MVTLKNTYQGMTLVELLVSLVLSAVLVIMMCNAFLLIKKNVLTGQALARVALNARTMDYLLGKALRNSGGFDCFSLLSGVPLTADQDISLQDYGLINSRGIKGVTIEELPKHAGKRVGKRAVQNSDLLWLQWGAPYERHMTSGPIFVRADCQKAHLTKIPTGRCSLLVSHLYYVGKTKRLNAKGKPIYALYSTDFNGRTLELVEGVEQLDFSYGYFLDGRLVYNKAQQIQNWGEIVSVRLSALLNSVEENDPKVQKWWSFEWPLMLNSQAQY